MDANISMTMEEAQREMELFRNVFRKVRLLSAEDLGIEEASLQNADSADAGGGKDCFGKGHCGRECVAARVLREKQQKTKLEQAGTELHEIFARYVEIDGKPYVMEMIRSIETEVLVEKLETESRLGDRVPVFYDMLYVDALSGAYNRRYFEDQMRKRTVTAGIAMFDLDDFKLSNDNYGHAVGDRLIRMVAETIQKLIRKTDSLIRYGGDEFLLVMPGISEKMFTQKLQEMLYQIRMLRVPDYDGLYLSVSIGGAMAYEETVEHTMRKADHFMYQAKRQKNTVVTEWSDAAAKIEHQQMPGEDAAPKEKILVVDDSEMNRAMISEMLGSRFEILEAKDGLECVRLLARYGRDISLVLLDIIMPRMDGFGVLEQMNRKKWIDEIPVIVISSESSESFINRAFDMGASDYIGRPFETRVVSQRVFNTIKLYARQRRLSAVLTSQIKEKEQSRKIMVAILSQLVEFRNGESGLHVQHINVLVQQLLEQLRSKTNRYNISWLDQDLIVMASSLHDIGKIGIDDKILNKPGPLTDEEYEIMKTHAMLGASVLSNLKIYREEPLVKLAYEICRWHHERYDGKGYPDGLKGEEIPISAQVVSLADVYDALVSERVYKKGYSHEQAMQMILNGECGSFNPLLLECLNEIQDQIPETVYGKDFPLHAETIF